MPGPESGMSPRRELRCIAIANRGEAALRLIRAVKALRAEEGSDLRVLALYTEVDRGAPFVRHADSALPIGPAASAVAAYLDRERLLAAARRGGADAVWPGWGFVAEDPEFADAVAAAGMVFLGPSGDTMRRLGDKIAAKRLAEGLGVPVAAWSGEATTSIEFAHKHAERIGYPLVIKAAAGGGGRGIRTVLRPEDLSAAFQRATDEARNAFGDPRVFLEQQVTAARHVEVQIAADEAGTALALGVRDCSIQRRHQKVIEEAPPSGLAPDLLARVEGFALSLVRAVGYVGVGTVEFLLSGQGLFFLEMNPRLQVEHGITEEVTGLDLVRLQIRIARGEALPKEAPPSRGVAMEARLCAEDPEAGFRPAPGRIVRFDPPLGPRMRVDSGVVAGCSVPAAFDSLIAKVIASGDTREEARARLVAALRDFELVIEGGATNRGFLIAVLESPEFRAGGVETNWLDRRAPDEAAPSAFAAEALVAAAILAYQRERLAARSNFYADTSQVSPSRVPPSRGQQIDLVRGGESYRLGVFAIGAWRYRVQQNGTAVTATLREEGMHAARLEMDGRSLRVLHDVRETGLRVEIEGFAHEFGEHGAGQVRAGSPAMVVALHAAPGDRVEAGEALGVLEAMKTEIGILAPVSGVVREVRVQRGQQVAAGDVLLVIDPGARPSAARAGHERIRLPNEPDPLDALFAPGPASAERRDTPDLQAAQAARPERRRAAIAAAREEIRRVLLGYDADPERGEKLAAFLEAPLPGEISPAFRSELAELRHELTLFADIERLFIRTPGVRESGETVPSNLARLRMYVRRLHAEGTGVDPAFLSLVRAAVAHYGVTSLFPSDALERAVLRLLATQHTRALRRRLVLGIVRRVTGLKHAGLPLRGEAPLADALASIAELRSLVSDALADAALEATYVIFETPESAGEGGEGAAEARQILDLAPQQQWAALDTQLRRLYAPLIPVAQKPVRSAGREVLRARLGDGRALLAAAAQARVEEVAATAEALCISAREAGAASALELLVPWPAESDPSPLMGAVEEVAMRGLPAERLTLSLVREGAPSLHQTFVPEAGGIRIVDELHGLHPEYVARVDLRRLAAFELERLDAQDGVVAFYARSRELPGDERVFVLAEVAAGSAGERSEAAQHLAAFERTFHAAARTLRAILGERDPKRRLQWNRIFLFVGPRIFLDPETAGALAGRLAPATRHLGLEKVVVRLALLDRSAPEAPPKPIEIVISDPTGARMEISWRAPHREHLRPASQYERRVVDARRRRLVYPYEIVRMLTTPHDELPAGLFEEYDLAAGEPSPRAVSVAGRPYGDNSSAIVFGILSTPLDDIPEGADRVVILSDPTLGMGSLAAPECDRIVAAIDLAEQRGIPVEWVPVSSGARIAMDSGTENLDATARVARRIVTFTQAGGVIHLIVHGVNVGAQSYWNALATMGMGTKGVLIMTPNASMVLTGRAALEASGAVAAEDEIAIGGYERVMGANGEAQYYARDLAEAYALLYQHYRYSYVVPGERTPRRHATEDLAQRDVCEARCEGDGEDDFQTVGEIFDARTNPDRKRPFAMRKVMGAIVDRDGGHLERWRAMIGAETAIVWDAQLGGFPVCLIGIESRSLPRQGYRPTDGPGTWTAATLFPLSSKKVARALNAASGNRPVVILANLSGFDGSPESMRKLQLEYGAEIARAVVNFQGPLFFLVVSRYHGGAYVVFSRTLNEQVRALALGGSFASVIGGGPAATVVFGREVGARAAADPRIRELRRSLGPHPSAEARAAYERRFEEIRFEKQAEIAAEFDAIHTVERAHQVGSLERILPAPAMRPLLIELLEGEVSKA
jgi:acetyl/propionyl-CoA carboxylase alpha subunit/acetyl-CoA carboxylase carboxyltransferase component